MTDLQNAWTHPSAYRVDAAEYVRARVSLYERVGDWLIEHVAALGLGLFVGVMCVAVPTLVVAEWVK